jgi:hypothetical protein
MASHDFKVDWQGEASNDAGSGKKSSSSSGAWQSLGEYSLVACC